MFAGEDRQVAEDFARADPYVVNGLVALAHPRLDHRRRGDGGDTGAGIAALMEQSGISLIPRPMAKIIFRDLPAVAKVERQLHLHARDRLLDDELEELPYVVDDASVELFGITRRDTFYCARTRSAPGSAGPGGREFRPARPLHPRSERALERIRTRSSLPRRRTAALP